ncbi:MAG: hypothetical protein Q9192_007211 [Flavoplaca navasiana]
MMVTPVRRKPVPVPVPAPSRNINIRGDESPLALRSSRVDGRARAIEQREKDDEVDEVDADADEETFARYRWRRGGPKGRPPIPSFESRGVTERELLDEVEDARRILEGGGIVGGDVGGVGDGAVDGVEDKREEEGGDVREGGEKRGEGEDEGRGEEEDEERGMDGEEVVCEDANGKEQDGEKSDSEAMDFFWVDDEGGLEYRRCRLPL